MGVFYDVSDRQSLNDRNELFKEVGIPTLKKDGFMPAPFKTSWRGQYDKSIHGYIYEFSRLRSKKYLERIDVYIMKGERWIQIFLNIFQLSPELDSIAELNKYEGLKLVFHLTVQQECD